MIGAIGVSGSTVENDHAVAVAWAAALGGPNVETAQVSQPDLFDQRSSGGGAPGGVLGDRK